MLSLLPAAIISTLITVEVSKAQEFKLPGRVTLNTTESLVPLRQNPGRHIKYKQSEDNDTYTLMPSSHPAGMGYIQFSSSSEQESEAHSTGDLEVYLVHSESYILPEFSEAGINFGAGHQGPLEFTSPLGSSCQSDQISDCNFQTYTLTPDKKTEPTLSSHPHLGSRSTTIRSASASVRRLTFMGVRKGDIDFINPTVFWGEQKCRMGEPKGASHCRELSSVILRFIPHAADHGIKLVLHIIDPEKAAYSEKALESNTRLKSDQSNKLWLAVLDSLFKYRNDYPIYDELPAKGVPHDTLMPMLKAMADREQEAWIHGTCSGTMYCGELDFYEEQNKAFSLFSPYNALQSDMHPSLTKIEAEIVAMTLKLHGAADLKIVREEDDCILDEACGYVTLGGTESNMSAMRAIIGLAKQEGVHQPVIIAPDTIHSSVDKAAAYYGFTLKKARTHPETKKVDVEEVRRMIDEDRNVVAIAASAPGYSHGTTDPIEQLSDLLMDYKKQGRNLLFHVDACMGGFIYPFAHLLGEGLNDIACDELKERMGERFDEKSCHRMTFPKPLFSYPGVTSVSADLHKYGYSIKGNSVLMFHSEDLMLAQFFSQPEWDGGAMANYGSFGSRSGGLLAAGYYTMLSLGYEGYMRRAWKILLTAHRFQNIVRSHPELTILGDPGMCFAFTATDPSELNIFHIADQMRSKTPGWRFNHLQHPDGLHFCLTGPQTWLGQRASGKTDPATGIDIPDESPEIENLLRKLQDTAGNATAGERENALRELANIFDQNLERDLSRATMQFEKDLAEALATAPALKDRPAMSGSMYGLGATGIAIDNLALRKAILEAGLLIMRKTPSRGLDSLLKSGQYRVEKILRQTLQLPAY